MSPSRERMIQQEYWKEHTSTLDGATVEAMMLDSQVQDKSWMLGTGAL